MNAHKQLFFIALALTTLLGGCGILPPAPVEQPPAPQGSTPIPPIPAPVPPPAYHSSESSERSPELLLQALSTEGFDYHWGGQSHASGFDCSGLVAHVFLQAYGMKLPHNARAQSHYGRPVALANLQIGDLVFFNTEQPFSHVGIYVGDQRFIHAPKTGAVVRTELMTARYWKKRFDGARRLIE
jgi:cell wall-associated NlpC family hydrolase